MNDTLDVFVNWLARLPSQPVVVMLLLGLPIAALAWWKRIYPSGTLVAWMLLPAAIAAGLLVNRDWLSIVLAVDAALILIALLDLGKIPGHESFSVRRECQRIASLRQKHLVTLTVTNVSHRAQSIRVRDGVPQEFESNPDEFDLELPPRSRATVHAELKASRRGAFEIDAVHLKVRSRLGLWQRLLSYPMKSIVHVYPDLKQLSEYALLARTNRLNLMGVRRTRRIGQDNEFERLRDYTLDDHYKHIDWRSTARRNKLTVKEFQSNQSQRVMFLVDCGRMMTNEANGISLLDHALNSTLMLSYVALQQGDAVGLITFSDRIHSSVPAQGGRNQMNRLLHAAFDRFPQLVESRYEEAFLHLATRCRKRSLVVLMTNVIDEVNAQQVLKYLSSFSSRHLPLTVLMRDHRMFAAAQHWNASATEFYRCAAASDILTWRRQVINDLNHQGVLVVDAFPEQVTAPLVNRYLEIKARHLL